MMSKKKILKGLEQHISNSYCCLADFQLNDEPSPNKEEALKEMKNEHQELISIKNRLQEILIG